MSGGLTTLAHLDLAGQAALLRQAQALVMAADAADAADAAEQARMARDWLKVVKGSQALAVEATRLECMALRRIGSLDDLSVLPATRRAAARWYAGLTDAGFAALLADIKGWVSALAIYRRAEQERRRDDDRRAGAATGEGREQAPHLSPQSLRDLIQAASALVGNYTSDELPFSVSEAAEELAESVASPNCANEPAFREGCREAIRQALALDDGGVNSDLAVSPDAPAWVTYHDDDGGWLRIPWSRASLEQFRAMVDLRRLQHEQLAAVVERLADLLGLLDGVKADHPHIDDCFRLDVIANGCDELLADQVVNARKGRAA